MPCLAIAMRVYGKGPHPGFKVYAHRVEPEEASTGFMLKDDMDPMVLGMLGH